MNVEPLYGLRLRTPRLELRLGTRAELDELYDVAAAGIHAPDWMPFAVPWTDDLERERFVAFHEEALADWRPEDWTLNVLVWAEGELAGSQGIGARRFAERRTVETGSWLGSRFQRRGIGTEMRAAVLELAFAGLGAQAAESGAIAGNAASLGVSRKLGYRVVGHQTIAPRGEPVGHDDLRLERGNWHPPVAVEIDGLEPCLQLFGAAADRSSTSPTHAESDPNAAATAFVRAETEWPVLEMLGLQLDLGESTLKIDEPAGVPVISPRAEDIALGLAGAYGRGNTWLRDWARVLLASNFIDLVALEDHPQGELLLGAIWAAAAGEGIDEHALDIARRLGA